MKEKMKRFFFTVFFTAVCLILGAVIMFLSFSAVWMVDESPGFFFFMVVVSALSFFYIPWFFTGIDDRCWYLYSLAVALPNIILFSDTLFGNYEHGHFPVVVATPLFVSVFASFSGGYLKKKRFRGNHPKCD